MDDFIRMLQSHDNNDTRAKKLHEAFGIPANQDLINEYMCGLYPPIGNAVIGRFYVFPDYGCFKSGRAAFRNDKMIEVFRWDEVVAIEKNSTVKTQLLAPNAIEFTLDTGKKITIGLTFARDEAYAAIESTWRSVKAFRGFQTATSASPSMKGAPIGERRSSLPPPPPEAANHARSHPVEPPSPLMASPSGSALKKEERPETSKDHHPGTESVATTKTHSELDLSEMDSVGMPKIMKTFSQYTGQDFKPFPEIHFNELELEKVVGQGAFGKVWKAYWQGTEVACKQLVNADTSPETISSFEKELCIMSMLRHPNVILLLGASTSEPMILVSDFLVNGSVTSFLKKHGKLDFRQRIMIALDTARGMAYLHSRKILHRDLKSLNVLLDANFRAKVCDFGLSRVYHASAVAMTSGVGSPHWMAPEVLMEQPYSSKADVYSFGIMMWELYTSKLPYEGLQSMQIAMGVVMGKRPDVKPETLDEPYVKLMQRCWDKEPDNRPEFKELIVELQKMLPANTPSNVSLKGFAQSMMGGMKVGAELARRRMKSQSICVPIDCACRCSCGKCCAHHLVEAPISLANLDEPDLSHPTQELSPPPAADPAVVSQANAEGSPSKTVQSPTS